MPKETTSSTSASPDVTKETTSDTAAEIAT